MNKIALKMILTVNALIWIILSAVNYVGIMLQLNEDIMSIFLWSIFTIMMYGLVVYSISLVITRLYLIYHYRNNKVKYSNKGTFLKQSMFLAGVILYLYIGCYYNSNLLGLLPIFIFFGKKLTEIGMFYVYREENLVLIDEAANEYLVTDINLHAGKMEIQEMNKKNSKIKDIQNRIHPEELKFLTDFYDKEMDVMEVA